MRSPRLAMVCFLFVGLSLMASESFGQDKDKNPAATPSARKGKDGKDDPNWLKTHDKFVSVAKKGDVEVLFLGDSITAGWNGKGKKAWDTHIAPLKPANFGIGGDRTEHVLFRIQNGELDGINPKAIVLMIGTNNSGSNSAEHIAGGVTAIVKTLREKKPSAKILLLAVFPRSEKATDGVRGKLAEVNKIISKLDDGTNVTYLDIGSKFLKDDGTLTREIMPDLLHLSERGYEIWAENILPSVKTMVGKK